MLRIEPRNVVKMKNCKQSVSVLLNCVGIGYGITRSTNFSQVGIIDYIIEFL
jgi:hypothetical protein